MLKLVQISLVIVCFFCGCSGNIEPPKEPKRTPVVTFGQSRKPVSMTYEEAFRIYKLEQDESERLSQHAAQLESTVNKLNEMRKLADDLQRQRGENPPPPDQNLVDLMQTANDARAKASAQWERAKRAESAKDSLRK